MMMKKTIAFLLVLTTAVLTLNNKAHAQETVANPLDQLKQNISTDKPNLWQWIYGKYDAAGAGGSGAVIEEGVIPSIEAGILGQLVGVPDNYGNQTGGAIQTVAGMIGNIYASPPASGVYYASTILQKFGGAPAYAANGAGFLGLTPLLNIWKAFRNMAYALLTIVFLVVGLMIMFRIQISQHTVMTIENALPKIIGILVLITFSYAIAGFLIDLMYVFMAILIAFAKQGDIQGIGDIIETQQEYANAGMGRVGAIIFPTIFRSFDDFTKIFYGSTGMFITTGITGAVIGGIIGSLIAPGPGTIVGAIVGGAAGGLTLSTFVMLIISIVAIFLLFKLWFSLIKIYISIILQIIFSPLFILGGALPNSSFGFGQWLKGLIANLFVFPIIVILLLIAYTLSRENASLLWTPPFLTGSGLSNGATGIIALGFLLILPSVPDIVKGAMGVKDSGIGGMISTSLGPAKTLGATGFAVGSAIAQESGGLEARLTAWSAGRGLGKLIPSKIRSRLKEKGVQTGIKEGISTLRESVIKKTLG